MLGLAAVTAANDGRAVASVTRTNARRSSSNAVGRRTHRRHERARKQHGAAAGRAKASSASTAHSAADPRVAIADFSFTPATTTIHVGETVEWVNNGPSAHTATANDGSFNTGVLLKGQSATVTFDHAGTFPYHCSIHPFMHGTVVVLANTKTPSPKSSHQPSHPSSGPGAPSNTTPPSNGGAGHGSQPSAESGPGALPFTGGNVVAVVVLGFALSGSGLFLLRLHRRGLRQ